jgi:hypothetical protein
VRVDHGPTVAFRIRRSGDVGRRDSAIMLISAGRTLKKDALPITCGASLTRPPRLVFALSDVAHVLEIAAARALRAKRRPVQVVADVPGTVALEWHLPPGDPLVCATASAGRHPRFPSFVHVITVATAFGRHLTHRREGGRVSGPTAIRTAIDADNARWSCGGPSGSSGGTHWDRMAVTG